MKKTRSHLRGWIEAACAALGAGCAAVVLQPTDASLSRQVLAFVSAAAPVLAVHARGRTPQAVAP